MTKDKTVEKAAQAFIDAGARHAGHEPEQFASLDDDAQNLMRAAIRAAIESALTPTPSEGDGDVVETWQPIETAPKDGTVVLATALGYEWPEAIRWEPYSPDVAEDVGEEGYWTFAEELLSNVASPDMDEISHWMPLPQPPALSTIPPLAEGGEE